MNKPIKNIFSPRPFYVLELPLRGRTRILHPEQVVIKIGAWYKDIGALCFAMRSGYVRKPGQPSEVRLDSFLQQRPKQIIQVVNVISGRMADAGKSPYTVYAEVAHLKLFMDWADANGHHDCLAGGDATRSAFHGYAADVEDLYRRHAFQSRAGWRKQAATCELLKAITGIPDLERGVRFIRQKNALNNGTEPAAAPDFAHSLAMSQMMFDGLCDLVLENKPFPFKLELPKSLGWIDNFLWLFPKNSWRLAPHQWGTVREGLKHPCWAYNYEFGRLATVDEIAPKYGGNEITKRNSAVFTTRYAKKLLNEANGNPFHSKRIMLGMIALKSFFFLFIANTGANFAVAKGIETDGVIAASVVNQSYREIKFRAAGKVVPIVVPVSFMPTLRRFMDLRKYLLNGASSPYLFFTVNFSQREKTPTQISNSILSGQYNCLRKIDPNLPKIGAQKIRATVDDYYLQKHEVAIAAKVMGHTEATELKKYGRGSQANHHDDMTAFLKQVSTIAKKQKVVPLRADLGNAKPLEQGGGCHCHGQPEGMSNDERLQPNCKEGCYFCMHRVLVADEEDVRKVASASFVMEQLILGPIHEEALRPLIQKCDEDLNSIASVGKCGPLVERVKNDVYENGNLTPFWTDKYQLFLELEVII